MAPTPSMVLRVTQSGVALTTIGMLSRWNVWGSTGMVGMGYHTHFAENAKSPLPVRATGCNFNWSWRY